MVTRRSQNKHTLHINFMRQVCWRGMNGSKIVNKNPEHWGLVETRAERKMGEEKRGLISE